MDCISNVLIASTHNGKIKYYDLRGPKEVEVALGICFLIRKNDNSFIFQEIQTPLKMQTRVVSLFPNPTGFAIGSIEGYTIILLINFEFFHTAFKGVLESTISAWQNQGRLNYFVKCQN